MGAEIDKSFKYAAFISYAHADERVAKRLHEALETYPLPKAMRAWNVKDESRAKLSPIFRDVAELTAHHSLSEKIREAVKSSRFLILLCSPAAKKSHWVNEEIKLFRKLHGEAAILAVIVKGKPDTAFPPALTEGGREPLAADMTSKEGFKFGVAQLAASMLGVGLDTLLQRDQRRRRLRTQLFSSVSTAIAVAMGALAWTAIDARDDAEEALEEALTARNASEGMVEFLIKDFKEQLVPLQKLDLFDSVGQRVNDYYDDIPVEDMDDDRLMRRARALHVLGEVEISRGKYEDAKEILNSAYVISKNVYARNPDNTDAIFTHAQSEYWMGVTPYLNKGYSKAELHWKKYETLAKLLIQSSPKNPSWIAEVGWGNVNLGNLNLKLQNYSQAETYFEEALVQFHNALKNDPDYHSAQDGVLKSLSGAANSTAALKDVEKSIFWRRQIRDHYVNIVEADTSDYEARYRLIQTEYRLLELQRKPICSEAAYKRLFEEITALTEYDKTNLFWQREKLSQWKTKLVKCHEGNSLNVEIDLFLEAFEPYQTDSRINRETEEIRSLRIKALPKN